MPLASITDNYLSLLDNFARASPTTTILAIMLIMARMVPIMILAPFFGAKVLPNPIKLMFALALSAIFLPQTFFLLKKELDFNFVFAALACKEVLIGFILAYLSTLPFMIAQSAGSYIEHIRGASSLQVHDPVAQNSTAPLGILYNYILIVIFYFIGGPIYFLDAVGKSLELIPVDSWVNPLFFNTQIPFWQLMLGIIQHVVLFKE